VLGPAPQTDPDDVVAADGGTATLTPTTVANPGYQRLASFTSGGPRNLNSAPKPDVTAPGVSVVSTLVGSGDAATRISGTSMASPMTAGVAALVTQAHPDWPSEWIKAAIMNTANATSAKIINPPGANTYDPRRAGTGVVDARRAVDTVAFATTPDVLGALAFGDEALTGPYTETLPFTLSNTSDSDITYDLTTAAFSGLGAGNSPTVTFSDNPVTVPAGDSATVDVTLSLTAAQVAALPGASVSNFGALATFRGAVVATPTSSGAGIYELRIPLLLAPRGLSGVTAGVKGPYQQNGSMFTTTVPLTNSGIHSGIADVYSWGFSDPNDVTGAEDGMDVRAAGVQVLPGEELGGDPSDRALVFAVNVYGKYSNPAVNEIDIALDTEGNSNPEFFVVGVDFGAITTGTFDGRFASVILDPEGNLVNAWVAGAPMNGSTMLLPTLASDVGLSTGSDKVRYTVTAFSLIPDGLVDSTATGQFRVYHPPVSTGDFIALAPGGSATLSLTLDKGNFAGTPVLGWIVQTQDDANGAAQADLIPAAPLP
jgi:minor extracellular serine protease Vpr